MNDDFLKRFRKQPRPEFAEALYEQLTQQADADMPRAPFSPDGRDDSDEQEDKDLNAQLYFATLTRRQTYRGEGRLVALAAAAAAILITALVVFNGLYNANVPGGLFQPTAESPTMLFERYINEAWNAGNTSILDDLLAADHVCYDAGMTEGVVGVEHIAAMIDSYRTAFPNWKFTIEDLAATEDTVWARLVGTGSLNGTFTFNYPDGFVVDGTGGPHYLDVMIVARFAGGQITEQRWEYDRLGLLLHTMAIESPQTHRIEQRNMELTRRYYDAYNQHDINGLRAFYNTSYVMSFGINRFRNVSTNTEAAFRTNFEQGLWYVFPDLQATITNTVAAGDTVIVETRMRGTFEQAITDWVIADRPASHRVETWSWLSIFRFDKDGKIVEWRIYQDGFPGGSD